MYLISVLFGKRINSRGASLVQIRVAGPHLVFHAGCRISGRIFRSTLPDNPAISYRMPDIRQDNPALPDIRPNPSLNVTTPPLLFFLHSFVNSLSTSCHEVPTVRVTSFHPCVNAPGWKFMTCTHCQELRQQPNWLLIGCTRVTNQMPGSKLTQLLT